MACFITLDYRCLLYECSVVKDALGGGGNSSGLLWNCARIDKLPLTGIDALPGAKAAGCSLRGTRTFFWAFLKGR